MLVLRRLVALVATVVLAPCVTLVVFDTLAKPYFAPGETLEYLLEWLDGWLLHGDLGYSGYYGGDITWVIREGLPANLSDNGKATGTITPTGLCSGKVTFSAKHE